jgi:anti-sigma factor RsiW
MGASVKNEPGDEPLVARDATYYRAPEALRERVRSSVRARARERLRPMLWRWGGMAAAFAATIAVTWNLALMEARNDEVDRLAREVQSAHVRSLMVEGHLNDVASSDRHTVKPWFEGKLDFAPRVEDPAASGFALVGGRLDYLDGRPVAALTYRHRLHVVNLFEWPAPNARDSEPTAMSRKGYAIAHWRRAGLEYWAVSDIEREDLLQFARLVDPK